MHLWQDDLLSVRPSAFVVIFEGPVFPCQRAKKVVSDILGLVNFAIGIVIFVLNSPDEQVLFFGEIKITEGLLSVLLIKKVLGLVEMTCGLVHASYSLPKRQDAKTDFLCTLHVGRFSTRLLTINHFPVHYQLQTLSISVCKHRSCSVPWRVCNCLQNPDSETLLDEKCWCITSLTSFDPHTFYRRTAIKLLNSVEECFRNNFQTKKLGQKAKFQEIISTE